MVAGHPDMCGPLTMTDKSLAYSNIKLSTVLILPCTAGSMAIRRIPYGMSSS